MTATRSKSAMRTCVSCRARHPAAEMEQRDSPSGPKWLCPSCPRRRQRRATIDAGGLLGRYRVLARRGYRPLTENDLVTTAGGAGLFEE